MLVGTPEVIQLFSQAVKIAKCTVGQGEASERNQRKELLTSDWSSHWKLPIPPKPILIRSLKNLQLVLLD
jgi:hypothetical protein